MMTNVPHHLDGIDLLIFLHPPMVVGPHHLHGIDLRKPVTVWNGVTGDCNSKTAFNWYAVRTKVRTETPFLKCVIMKGCQYGYQRKGILIGTLDRLAV